MYPPSPTTNTLTLFYSYAHEDELLRNELDKQLSLLRRQGHISTWYDRDISAGAAWQQEIDTHLDSADIILLLVSPDFLASDYCYSIEMDRAMHHHDTKAALVIPIILRAVNWEDAPFGKLQALPTGAQAITSWPNRDEAFKDVATGIRNAIKELQAKQTAMRSPLTTPRPATSSTGPLASSSTLWNIPFPRNPFFTGRETILADLRTTLTSEQRAAITQPQAQAISGLGGIGKTQTAIEYAYRYRDEYQAVLWVRSSTREELVTDLIAIADLLRLPEKDAQDTNVTAKAVTRWLETQTQWLLIFDNADNLTMMRDYLPAGNRGHVLLTTRAQAMSGLARKVEIARMKREEGALFLLRRAGLIAPDARFEDASAPERANALTLVQELDGLPLALDQAGAYIEETRFSLSGYLMLYRQQRANLLAWRGGRAFEHPAPVTTTWSLSFEKVEQANPAASDLLRLCAFLAPDAIPEEMFTKGREELGSVLQPIAADPFTLNLAIRELLNYSLVERDPETQTLSMHRLVQAVLRDNLDEETQHRWAACAVRTLSVCFPDATVANWPLCQRYLPHALVCTTYIQQWAITSPEATTLLFQAGHYCYRRGQYPDAGALWKQALTVNERVLGAEHPDTLSSLNNLALLYAEQGKYELAEPLYQRALASYERVLGAEHPNTLSSLNNLAGLYHNQGKYELAEPLYQRALATRERVLGAEHPDTLSSLNNLASLYWNQGKYELAEPLYQGALATRERVLGPEHPDTATVRENYTNLLRKTKRNYSGQLE